MFMWEVMIQSGEATFLRGWYVSTNDQRTLKHVQYILVYLKLYAVLKQLLLLSLCRGMLVSRSAVCVFFATLSDPNLSRELASKRKKKKKKIECVLTLIYLQRPTNFLFRWPGRWRLVPLASFYHGSSRFSIRWWCFFPVYPFPNWLSIQTTKDLLHYQDIPSKHQCQW